jgi:hypothetical protein
MNEKPRHHQDCPWQQPHESAAGEPLVYGPVCECDALWASDLVQTVPPEATSAHLRALLAEKDETRAELEVALAEARAENRRLDAENEVLADQRDALRREVIAAHAEVSEQLADARRRAVREYVFEGAAGDAWLTVAQVRQALDQADTARDEAPG